MIIRNPMWFSKLYFLLLLAAMLGDLEFASATESIGICWGRIARQPIPTAVTIKQLQDNNVTYVKLFSADPEALGGLAGTDMEVMVMLRNQEVVEVAQSMDAAQTWVDNNVQLWLPAGVNIKYVSVGNEPYLSTEQDVDEYILDGVKNIYQALVNDEIDDKVKITVSFNSEILNNTDPPSRSVFVSKWESELTYIAGLIYNTSSVFSVNIYPFYNFYSPTSALDPSLIFFDRAVPSSNGAYTNVFEASVDATLYALEAAGIPSDVELVIGEIGWPTDGNSVATISLAQEFNQGVLKKMLSGAGTIKRPNWIIRGYLFSLFDEDAKSIKPGAFERKWGIYDNHGDAKYNLDLTGGGDANKEVVATPGIYLKAKKWCIARSDADETNLTVVFEKICEGAKLGDYADMADCTPVTANFSTPGDVCGPASLRQGTSYALNQYFQATSQNESNCDWDGLAQVTSVDPSFGDCTFQIGLDIEKIGQFTTSSSKFSFYVLIYIVSLIMLLTTFL